MEDLDPAQTTGYIPFETLADYYQDGVRAQLYLAYLDVNAVDPDRSYERIRLGRQFPDELQEVHMDGAHPSPGQSAAAVYPAAPYARG